jgi:hypothetical protein
VVVDRVVACPGIGSGQAAETLVALVGASGEYHAVRVAADRVQFARTFRPTWATVLGWCLLPVLLLGIVFFFVKTTETCVAVVEADHRGTRIRLSGRLDATVLQRLVATFDDPHGAARDAAMAAAVGAPVTAPSATGMGPFDAAPINAGPPPAPFAGVAPLTPPTAASVPAPPGGVPASMAPPAGSPVPMAPPAGPPVALPAPAGHPVLPGDPGPTPLRSESPGAPPYLPLQLPDPPPEPNAPGSGPAPGAPGMSPGPATVPPAAPSKGWVPVWEREESSPDPSAGSVPSLGFDPSSTIVTPHRRAGGPPALRAVLDDGTELDLTRAVLLGRDPSAGHLEGTPSLVPVADPERSVSKTHLKIEMLGGVVLATDRGSTNGSVIVRSDGAIVQLEAGVATEVPAGSVVRFGARSVRVLTAASTGGSL